MTTVISGDPGALGGLAALRPTANETDPEWLLRIRRDAAAWFHDHGLPTRKDEDWRYTRLEPITTVPFRPAVPGNWPVSDVAATDLGGPRLVFVNGHFRADRSRLAGVPSGARVTNLATAIAEDGDRVRSAFTGAARPEAQAFEELNTVLAEDGAYIHLAPGTVVDQPIELVFLSDVQGEAMVASPRSILLAEPNSKVTVVETHCASGGGAQGSTLSNAVTQVVLGDEADVALYRVQDEPETAFHIALLDVRQGPRSRFAAHSFAIGAAMGRHEVRVRLEGAGAEVHLHGLSMSRGDQQHDNPILVEHIAPHCTSRQLYKGIADGGSHSVFNGHIVVRPGAEVTDARQVNKNLLLSERAEVDTRPRLEILTDDVQCSHGAAVGRLDEDALHYLRARGIPYEVARGMLIFAFANEMVELIGPAPLRERVERLVEGRLSVGTPDGPTGGRR